MRRSAVENSFIPTVLFVGSRNHWLHSENLHGWMQYVYRFSLYCLHKTAYKRQGVKMTKLTSSKQIFQAAKRVSTRYDIPFTLVWLVRLPLRRSEWNIQTYMQSTWETYLLHLFVVILYFPINVGAHPISDRMSMFLGYAESILRFWFCNCSNQSGLERGCCNIS